jgi:hypothetical protein
MTLQLLHSESPHLWRKFYFIFYQCVLRTLSTLAGVFRAISTHQRSALLWQQLPCLLRPPSLQDESENLLRHSGRAVYLYSTAPKTDDIITEGFLPHILFPGFYHQPARIFINNKLRGLFYEYDWNYSTTSSLSTNPSLFHSFILAFTTVDLIVNVKVEKSSSFLSFILAFVTLDLTLKRKLSHARLDSKRKIEKSSLFLSLYLLLPC